MKRIYPDIRVYDEQVPQGFETPSFFIWTISGNFEGMIGRRYLAEYKMVVRYFDTNYTALNAMAKQLYHHMQLLSYKDVKLRGRKLNHVIEDSTLHFFVDVIFYLDKIPEEETLMAMLDLNNNLKG